jgi:hypothetical protein
MLPAHPQSMYFLRDTFHKYDSDDSINTIGKLYMEIISRSAALFDQKEAQSEFTVGGKFR